MSLLDDYFGDVKAPEGEEEEDAANDETFGVDTDDIVAGDQDSDAVWKAAHEELAARIEHEKEDILRKKDASDQKQSQPPRHAAHPQQLQHPHKPRLSAEQLKSLYMQEAQGQQQHYAMMQRQQRAFAEQRQHVMLQHQQYLRQNPAAGPQLQAAQQQLVVQQQQLMAQMQHQMQARQLSLARIQAALHAQAQVAPPLAGLVGQTTGIAVQVPCMFREGDVLPSQQPMPGGARAMGGRVEEIERQMAAAGLGPAAASQRITAQRSMAQQRPPGFPTPATTLEEIERNLLSGAAQSVPPPQAGQQLRQQARANGQNVGRLPGSGDRREETGPRSSSRRRLESMTDRDMELVLRMHLRQLETAVPYKDEYYAFALKEKQAAGSSDLFERLANVVNGMDPASTRSGGKRFGPKGARLSASDAADNDDTRSVASTSHAPENMSTLASALGTLQVWNPKAPRKLVDFGTSGKSATQDENFDASADGKTETLVTGNKLLREDDRIVVRSAVEEGYDVLAALHDVARRKSNASVDSLVKSLFVLLRLPAKSSGPASVESDAFFVRMCGFGKGKQFVARVFAVLKPRHRVAVACAVMRNLYLLSSGESWAIVDKSHTEALWSAVKAYVREGSTDTQIAVDLLAHFDAAHKEQGATLVTAMRSAAGSSLVYTAMQRVYGALNSDEFDVDTAANVTAAMGSLCDTIKDSLGEMFLQTDSSAGIWQVAAMLDALAPSEQQAKLRSTLKRLLEDGIAPPPPAA